MNKNIDVSWPQISASLIVSSQKNHLVYDTLFYGTRKFLIYIINYIFVYVLEVTKISFY